MKRKKLIGAITVMIITVSMFAMPVSAAPNRTPVKGARTKQECPRDRKENCVKVNPGQCDGTGSGTEKGKGLRDGSCIR
ncbi:hypothetical protein M2454_002277 [Aequitasia blattaphilus]|uniref:Secreted protein n=1 Tax=Aequitasia blattaphilus TaxID=2949332 RepID=A0ABT1EC70_9FIRM|nr:hypothetical protein [Aequitasia blattaphilus]MCP1103424.1 hypothetical protein [Aequitasia blattaphilus]MCR8616064.1 hypothetical protein [Aequitasia blattaphilus]